MDKEYEIFEEKGKWNGLSVWYVKPKISDDNVDGIPYFLLSDGDSFRYALTPEESLEILRSLGEN